MMIDRLKPILKLRENQPRPNPDPDPNPTQGQTFSQPNHFGYTQIFLRRLKAHIFSFLLHK